MKHCDSLEFVMRLDRFFIESQGPVTQRKISKIYATKNDFWDKQPQHEIKTVNFYRPIYTRGIQLMEIDDRKTNRSINNNQ